MLFRDLFKPLPKGSGYLTKTLRLMKLTAFLLFAGFMQVSANGISQTVTLSKKQVPLATVFREIQKQTGYRFFYTLELVENTSKIDIDVKKVSLEELQTPPYRARVDFYMVYYSPADNSELKRDLYTANFVFIFQSRVPNELIPINPLGLTISYFREDQAFK